MLLSLPIELVELILTACDTTTYLQLAFSCKTLLEIASTSRQLSMHRLSEIPGSRVQEIYPSVDQEKEKDPASLSNKQLFGLILKFSHQELYGAQFDNRRKFLQFLDYRLDTSASVLLPRASQSEIALLAFKGNEAVFVCGNVPEGDSTSPVLVTAFGSPASELGKTEVLFVAAGINRFFNLKDLEGVYVLHRFKPFMDKDVDPDHPFIRQAKQSSPNGHIFLAFHPDIPGAPIRLYSFPEELEYEPLAFTAFGIPSYGSQFAISWQHRQRPNDHHVVYYNTENEDDDDDNSEDDEDTDEDEDIGLDSDLGSDLDGDVPVRLKCATSYPYVLTETINHESADELSAHNPSENSSKPSTKLVFNDRGGQLLHFYRGQTLYGSFQKLHSISPIGYAPSPPNVSGNSCLVKFSESLWLQFAIDIPFFAHHEQGDPLQGGRCHWQYLAVGIATHRVEHWTVACLLKSEARPLASRCDHNENLDRGRRFDQWQIVARLDGYHESNTSHGSLVTASRRGTRVAAASWKTITVWSIHPNALIENDSLERDYYPKSWISPNGVIVLPPVVIEVDAVISQLRFTDEEDVLVAITDRGMMTLNLNPECRGFEELEYWSGTVEDEL